MTVPPVTVPAQQTPRLVGDLRSRRRWYWRFGGVAHRFVDTEPACGEPSGPEQWERAPASAPACAGCRHASAKGRA